MHDIDLESLARSYTTASIAALGAWATAKPREEGQVGGVDPDIKIRAIAILLDRGWGRPKQQQETKVNGAIDLIIRDIAAEKAKKK